jgi:quercetin dioxygenase-like cupin family protein
MATKGQVLIDPYTGDRFEFMETSEDTNGERLTYKATIKSKGNNVPDHLHIYQDELFEVISGKLTVSINGEQQIISAGQKIFLPKNNAHNHFNQEDTSLTYQVTITPALDFEYFIESLVNLAIDGKLKNGKAGLIQELVTLRYIKSKTYLAGIPIGLQKFLMYIIAPVGKRLGYKAIYDKNQVIQD